MERRCANCVYFVPIREDGGVVKGTCRKHPPTHIAGSSHAPSWWPVVRVADWCGEFTVSAEFGTEKRRLINRTVSLLELLPEATASDVVSALEARRKSLIEQGAIIS